MLVIALLELAIAATYVLSAVLLSALVIAIAYLVRTTPPPRYRCADCSAELPTWDLLVAHEKQHDGCHCGPGRHHPSCELRRAAA